MSAPSSASACVEPASTRPARLRFPGIIALAACLVAGVAFWFTRATLDVFGDERGTTRVAMLPSWPELAGLIILTLIVGVGSGALLARYARTGRAAIISGQRHSLLSWPQAIFQISFPLFASIALMMPYLPWLSDRWRALRALTAPMTYVVWFVLLAQVMWVAWSVASRSRRARVGDQTSRWLSIARPTAIFLLSLAAFGVTATRLTGLELFPYEDEPHYLVVMQSLWRDHDLKIENNYTRKDYADYYRLPLEPDYRVRGADGEIYSRHPIGLSLLGAPVYGLAGYRGVVWFLVLTAALTATLMWRGAYLHSGSAGAATFAWGCVCLGAPFLFNSFVVYPEMPAALCVMIAIGWRPSGRDLSIAGGLVRALAIGALPWLSAKYAPMAAALAVVLVWRTRGRRSTLLALLLPISLSVGVWLGFFYWIWGSWLPTVPVGPDRQTVLPGFPSGALGLLFDQEYGVLLFAPALAIGFVGLVQMWRSDDRASARRAAEIAVVGAVFLGTVGALKIWWGGTSPPGHPLVPALPLLGLPIAWQYRRSARAAVSRAAYQLLLLIGLAVSLILLFADNGLLVAQNREGLASWLGWLSPISQLWTLAPSFVDEGMLRPATHAALWTVVALAVGWLCRRSRVTEPGAAALVAISYLAGATLAMSLVTPLFLGRGAQPEINFTARSRVPVLDTFDATARPLAIIYNPFTIVAPGTIPPLMTLAASPELRQGTQPLRMFLNARFALSAGEYEVAIGGLPPLRDAGEQPSVSGTVGLQVGRIGSPLHQWEATLRPGETWRQTFVLPVDAEFVGFIVSSSLAPATQLWLRPLHIVDLGKRPAGPPVLSAAAYGSTSVFFRDAGAYTEPNGFWLEGRSTVHAVVMKNDASSDGVILKLHSGEKPNTVTLETPLWRTRVNLVPNVSQEVRIPTGSQPGPVLLQITTSDGFVPAEWSAVSTDRRLLGCWVEVIDG